MKNLTEYAIFVMEGYLKGCKIEWKGLPPYETGWNHIPYLIEWNWQHKRYRIKLPEGWEYVIEDEDIAIREPKRDEIFLSEDYQPMNCVYSVPENKRPIIKRVEK
jgi:hypothetical protein